MAVGPQTLPTLLLVPSAVFFSGATIGGRDADEDVGMKQKKSLKGSIVITVRTILAEIGKGCNGFGSILLISRQTGWRYKWLLPKTER